MLVSALVISYFIVVPVDEGLLEELSFLQDIKKIQAINPAKSVVFFITSVCTNEKAQVSQLLVN